MLRYSIQDSIIVVAQIWPTPDAFIRPTAWVDGTWSTPDLNHQTGSLLADMWPCYSLLVAQIFSNRSRLLNCYHSTQCAGQVSVSGPFLLFGIICVRIIISVWFLFYGTTVTDQDVIMWIYFPNHFRPTADVVASLCTNCNCREHQVSL